MRFFITGANGCIGNILVQYLMERNEIIALDINDTNHIKNVKIEYGDISDGKKMQEIFLRNKFDVVIHLAAIVHKPKTSENDYTKVNYHASDIFVLPSVANSEAFGIAQIEAMACGKPVVNTNLTTGVPWVSIHGETGLTVLPKDSSALAEAISLLLDNNSLRERYGENAKKRAREVFSKEIMIEKVLSSYVSLISNSS